MTINMYDKGHHFLILTGMERSGVTLLHSMLNSHRDICLYSASFVLNLSKAWQHGIADTVALERFVADLYAKTRFHNTAISKVLLVDALRPELPLEFSALCYRIACIYCEHNSDCSFVYWGERALVHTAERKRFYDKAFDNYKIIHLIRDGRAVLSSVLRAHSLRQGKFETDVLKLAHRWNKVSRTSALFRNEGNYHEVKYEDLITRPSETLSRVCNFLHLRYEDAMLQYQGQRASPIHTLLKSSPQKDRIKAWQGEAPARLLRIFDLLNREQLLELGYPPLPLNMLRSRYTVLGEIAAHKLQQYMHGIWSRFHKFGVPKL